MKILVTGFQPFGGEATNPSYEAVKLMPKTIQGAEIITMELPVVFGKSADVLAEAVERILPDAVICVGQAGGRSSISIERVAVNLDDARMGDNEGNAPEDAAIQTDGPAAYFAALPVKEIVENIRKNNIPARVSYTAGTYVCNHIMYQLLYLIERKYPKMLGGFIHVPYDLAQVVGKADGVAAMPIPVIAKGLEYAVEIVAETVAKG